MTKPVLQVIKSDSPEKWQEILADLVTDPKELVEILGLDPAANPHGLLTDYDFTLKVPRSLLARMERGNWNDPLLKQVWPAAAEASDAPGLSADPLEETRFNPLPGLLHKYHSRVLLTVAPHCAIHCRYCFRREFDYAANTPGRERWEDVLAYIRADTSISEVIFSGGDPLAAPDRLLRHLVLALDDIEHVQTLRIHTRLPIVIPQRVTPSLLASIQAPSLRTVVVVHCNHARELDNAVRDSLSMFTEEGVFLLNQSVILREVNDNLSDLIGLSRALFRCGVLPYYLHLPDAVSGTGHFHVGAAQARQLVAAMRSQLPGYLVPTLVQEIPGEASKHPLL